ncbi:MAG: sulfite exporter TauE/SafE family protein [Proteobacteria bacterium]|nr:sulfite exporter TauE/SafE family protein [Pseudomonadota bacterium]
MPGLLNTVFPSEIEFFAACFVFVLAEIIYVAFGFGAGLVAVSFLVLILPVIQDVVVVLLLVNLPIELVLVWSSRKVLSWRGLLMISVSIGIGIMLGTWLLIFGSPSIVLSILGGFLLLAGTGFALVPQKGHVVWPFWSPPIIGLISGILTGLFGTGGPPLIFYYQLQGVSKTEFRSNLMAIFLMMTAIRLPAYIFSGLITAPRILAALALVPAVLLGAFIGHRIHLQLDEVTFRRIVGVVLALIGIVFLARYLINI